MMSIGKGYDPGYLTKEIGQGAENYYLSAVREHGEPPGYWSGRGAEALGLAEGSEVDPKVMEALYGEFLDIRYPVVFDDEVPDAEKPRLGRRPAKYATAEEIFARKVAAEPEATEERREQLMIQAKGEARKALQFFDLTFSPSKSVTLTHAGLLALARRAEEAGEGERAQAARRAADIITESVKEAAAAGVREASDQAGWARTGYHGKKINGDSTGRWEKAGDWVVASFLQHTSRNGDPQLHVHQAVLNRQLCQDGVWRSLDGQAIYRARAGFSAVAERTLMESLTARLGVRWVQRADGQGWEIEGVTPEQVTEFSTRRVEVTDRVAELVAAYEDKHGVKPNARVLYRLAQQATKDTKAAKLKSDRVPSRSEELAAWEERTTRAEIDSLTRIPGRALFQVDAQERAAAAAELGELDMDQVIQAAMADAQSEKATFSRHEITRHLSRYLPPSLGGLDADQVRDLLHEMTEEALSPSGGEGRPQVLRLNVPDVVSIPESLMRDGEWSVFRSPSAERWTTADQLDTEGRFLAAAAQVDGPAVEASVAAARLGFGPSAERDAADAGTDAASVPTLGPDQAAAVYGVLTSGRRMDVLEGFAGTGKSYTVARLAEMWRELGGGRVVGLSTAQAAAQVLRDEGLDDAWNIERWLRKNHRLGAGDMVVVDEASMVTTEHLVRIQEAADQAGAKVVLTGDSEQLAAPGAGGLMRQLVAEHGSYVLTEVRRFTAEWERDASVRLRAGDEQVLAEYEQHGRLRGGSREEMERGAVEAYVADTLAGRTSLLLAATNERAQDLAVRVREALVRYGQVDDEHTVQVRGRVRIGSGDVITARRNDRSIPVPLGSGEQRELTNRDRLQVTSILGNGDVAAQLLNADGEPGEVLIIPAGYVSDHVELAYAGTVHSAQGRTVDTAHALVEEGMSRQGLYVEMSRGREGNWAWTVTETAGADLRPEPVPVASAADADVSAASATTDGPDERMPAASPEQAELADTLARTGGEEPEPVGPEHAPRDAADAADRDAVAVLAQVLETDQSDLTATETLRVETDRVRHMAHLGGMWTSVVKDAVADQTSAELAERLPADAASALEKDGARGSVITAARRAVLAGHDLGEVINRVTEASLDGARSVGQVLASRIERMIGTGDTVVRSWLGATPRLQDPELNGFVREVAEQMDARRWELGERAAADPPAYLAERLGPVPEEVMARTEWIRRAGDVEAYREQYGPESPDPAWTLGAAPDRHSPEQRASWLTAAAALGRTRMEQMVEGARDGALWVARQAYARTVAWAPPHMAEELREAHTERDDRAREAVRLRAAAAVATDERDRASLEAKAQGAQALADAAARRSAQLERVEGKRREWLEATEELRQRAMLADAELHRRHQDLELPPLHEPDRETTPDQAPEKQDPREQTIPGQEALFGLEEAGPVVRRGLTERPEPEVAEPEPQAPEYEQPELELGLAEEQPETQDSRLQRALEKAQAVTGVLARLARREVPELEGREAGQEPSRTDRERDLHRDELREREDAELARRAAQQREREQAEPEREKEGPVLEIGARRPRSREPLPEPERYRPEMPRTPEQYRAAPRPPTQGPQRGYGPSR